MKKSETIATLCGIVCIAGLLGYLAISSKAAKETNRAKRAQDELVQILHRKAQRLQEVSLQAEIQRQSESVAAAPEKQFPYKFLKTKTEFFADRTNIMDLYSFAGDLDPDTLKEFCLNQKKKNTAKDFYFLVIFDNPGNAKFPDNPFTAEYGSDEESLKSIRAIYGCNRSNDFSELKYHKDNIWENAPKREYIK